MPEINIDLSATEIEALKSWQTGFNNQNREPILILELHSGRRLMIQMPAQTARELGRSLQTEGERAAPPASAKPN
jgi:hypothetical protein